MKMIYFSKILIRKTADLKVITNDNSQLFLPFKGSIEFCLYSLQVGIYLLFLKIFFYSVSDLLEFAFMDIVIFNY